MFGTVKLGKHVEIFESNLDAKFTRFKLFVSKYLP